MKFNYKLFKTGSDIMLAIADSSIVGRKYAEGELQLEVNQEFYSDKNCDEVEAVELVAGATIVNAVGKDIISVLVKNNIIEESNVIRIEGMPHAQIITISK